MKKSYSFLLTLFTLVFLNLHHSQAQTYVTIPDANFRVVLKAKYPTCFNGVDQMDTQCSAVVNETALNVYKQEISNLDGLQYFINLKTLDCGFNRLTSLPSLPTNLTQLRCGYNRLSSLPTLPTGLIELRCDTNDYSVSLPSLPTGLKYFSCAYSRLGSLPSLPSSLETLICNDNGATVLPTLPASLTLLNCSWNGLSLLPSLPSGLKYLYCDYNKLTSLPTLPLTLTKLNCSGNKLTSLPSLPTSMNNLNASLDASYNCFTTTPVNPYKYLQFFSVTPNDFNCTITATESTNSSTTLSLYPNPTEDKVSLSNAGEITKLELYNSYGQGVAIKLDKATNQFSMEGLPSGIYTLSIVVDGKPVTMKVAKK